jgi:hypothetical protein
VNPPFVPVPTKTPLGVDEQRRRSAGLGQRHRTILFLVDGRRPLGEVLRLAQQAGATVQHFEDLVRLGHVDVPQAPADAAAPAAPDVDEVTAQSFAAEAPRGDDPPAAQPAGSEAGEPGAPAATAPATAALPDAAAPTPQPQPPSVPAAVPAVTPWASATVLPAFSLDLPPSPPAPPVLGEVAVPRVSGAPLVPVGPPPWRKPLKVAAPLTREDEQVLGAARARLLEALDRDPPLFTWGLATRIRGAGTAPALVDLTLELERTLDRRRRSPAGLAALEAARELLGLGNTVIADDSEPAWIDTR